MRRSRNFRQGGGGGGGGPRQSDKKSSDSVVCLFFAFSLVLGLDYRSQMVNFKENIIFQGSGGGPNFSRGSHFFQGGGGGGGGSNCLFPIGTQIICDFPFPVGGSGPPIPPLDPHLAEIYLDSQSAK